MTARPGPASVPGAAETASPASLTLKSHEFRKGREAGWQELEEMVGRVERRGIRCLKLDEVQRLPLLYRAAASSLSVARAIALDRHLLLYLENLTLRAFLIVYGPRQSLIAAAQSFFVHEFPASVRAARWHFALAVFTFLVGGLAGFLLVQRDEAWFSMIVPASLAHGRGPGSTRSALLQEEIFAPWPGFTQAFILMANFLFSHNTLVGVLSFTLGLAAGVPSLLLLAYQGLILGAFIALHADRGLTVDFLGWLSIHGVTETAAILLFGAGGLVIAEKALFPGRHGRIDSLAIHGPQAARVAVGGVFMLLVAAILEGGFRQLIGSTPWRFAIGFGTGFAWLLYFVSGRGGQR